MELLVARVTVYPNTRNMGLSEDGLYVREFSSAQLGERVFGKEWVIDFDRLRGFARMNCPSFRASVCAGQLAPEIREVSRPQRPEAQDLLSAVRGSGLSPCFGAAHSPFSRTVCQAVFAGARCALSVSRGDRGGRVRGGLPQWRGAGAAVHARQFPSPRAAFVPQSAVRLQYGSRLDRRVL